MDTVRAVLGERAGRPVDLERIDHWRARRRLEHSLIADAVVVALDDLNAGRPYELVASELIHRCAFILGGQETT